MLFLVRKPGIFKLTTRRGQSNLRTVFICVSCKKKGCYRIVSLGHLIFDCRSCCGLSRRMQGGSFHWKFSGINGISKKVVPFSRWKLPNGKFVFHLQISRLHCFYHQFHAFRGLLTGPRLPRSNGTCGKWNALFPKGNSQEKFFESPCKWKTPEIVVPFSRWKLPKNRVTK